ncbi:WbqC family protein, partial [bacterium]|nr:WbqC family protein [bacterium]
PFEYKQLWGSFQSNVTVLDYLMNCGYDWQQVVDKQNTI